MSIGNFATPISIIRVVLLAARFARPTLPFSHPFQAWIDGLYELWPGSSPDVPMQTDYEPLSSPVPTITIGNIVPELSPAVGPASISIAYV